jgi:hypothetical protein
VFSCEQHRNAVSDGADIKILNSTKSIQNRSSSARYIHTSYEYADSSGVQLIIQNSVPKSGINYTAPDGKKYVYAVFWTRIINNTASVVELNIDFPADSFEIPTSSGNYMKLLFSADSVTIAKETLPDYGLKIKYFADNNIHKPSFVRRVIFPKTSGSFYVVPLSTRGVNGTLRTGLKVEGQRLIYKVNDKEIYCGKINLKNLVLQK